MSNLKKAIQEEVSKILQSVESTENEMDRRNRKDRMQQADGGESGERWYTNESDGDVEQKIRQIVAEEYETLRNDPETSIEYRSGLRKFEASKSDRWWKKDDGSVDSKKIKEVAKKATKKVVQEMGGDTFRQRAENTRGFDGLYQIFQDMRRFLPGSDQVLQEMAKAMGRESLEEAITYIARMYDMQDIRRRAKRARSTGDLVELLDQMERFRGTENLINDLIQQMSNPELRNMIDHFDRLYIDQMPEYPNI